jgi:hypothetical protein
MSEKFPGDDWSPTKHFRQVEWPVAQYIPPMMRSIGEAVPMTVETVLEQMWVHDLTGEVDWRELETVTAREAGYLDDVPLSDSSRRDKKARKRV